MTDLVVRRAVPEDASTACALVRDSIVKLCEADHEGDQATISAWLANKTDAQFVDWIASPRHVALVAEVGGIMSGFALLNCHGTIALLYVAPRARFCGVSKALLQAIERHSHAIGTRELQLTSSATALTFYERCGYARAGDAVPGAGITRGYPMRKRIAALNESP